eukprot:145723-Amphidinium_carterae.1
MFLRPWDWGGGVDPRFPNSRLLGVGHSLAQGWGSCRGVGVRRKPSKGKPLITSAHQTLSTR